MNKRIHILLIWLVGAVGIFILIWLFNYPTEAMKAHEQMYDGIIGFGSCTSKLAERKTIIGTLCWNEEYSIYTTVQGRGIIWAYETDPTKLSDIEKMGYASLECMNRKFLELVILNPENFPKLITNIHPAFEILSEEHQAKYVMIQVLKEFGGVFVQRHAAAIKPFTPLFKNLKEYELIFENYLNYDDSKCAGTLGPVRAQGDFSMIILGKINKILEENIGKLREKFASGSYPFESNVFDKVIVATVVSLLETQSPVKTMKFTDILQSESVDFSCIKKRKTLLPVLENPEKSYKFFETEVHNFFNGMNMDFKGHGMELLLQEHFSHLITDLLKFSFLKCENENLRSTSTREDSETRIEAHPQKFTLMGPNRTLHEWNSKHVQQWVKYYMKDFIGRHHLP